MGITTFMGLLRFALLCIDLLAWPAIALGYPLLASIRAVESGSKYHMKKLVIYWTLFSLFSLFEFAFVKIIVWIPFWSSARLVIIFWLVMPQFDGACHAYQGLVRPVLLVKLQEVFDTFYKLKEERICKRETFLDVVEKYIKENGSEAMEKLIALEHQSQKYINSQREDTKVLELERKNAATTSKQLNEANAARRDTETLEATEKSAATKTPQVPYALSASSVNRTDAVTNVKEMTPPEASADDKRLETPPLIKTQQEWTCDLCKVTAMSEIILNAHLQGRKHKSKLESLKASMLGAKDTGPSPLGTYAAAEVKEMMQPKETAEKRCPETPPLKKAQQEWTCDLCKVTTTSEITLNGHFHGSKHKSKLETLKASKVGAKDTGPSPSATRKLNHGNVAEKFIKKSRSELKKLTASKIEAKETTPPEASSENRRVGTPPLKQAQQEWTCDLCKVTATSEKTLNAHFKGSKHKSNLESLKTSKRRATDTGHSPSATCKVNQGNLVGTENKNGEGSVKNSSKAEIFRHWCFVCNVKLLSDVDLASHLIGKRHSLNIEALIS